MFESGPPPGTWREKLSQMTVLESLFSNIIVALDDSSNSWNALEMAAQIANAERSSIHGIHIHADLQESPESTHDQLENEFYQNCQKLGVEKYDFFIAEGEVWKVLIDHSRFADLIVLPLNHPPGDKSIERLSSGLLTLIRGCPIPVLTIPVKPQTLQNIILAYDGSLKAQEALFIAAYLGSQFGTKIKVITSTEGISDAEITRNEAIDYLGRFPIQTESVTTDLDISTTISKLSNQETIDLILIGGYGGSSILPIMLGSVVDKVMREIQLPILICR
jgi:nucleotide-binding universal stress UspA family protein